MNVVQRTRFDGIRTTVGEVSVQRFEADDPTTPKGSRTWNFLHPPEAPAGRTMIAQRFKGDEVGHHFHPRVPDKMPEVFLVIRGAITFSFRDLSGGTLKVEINADRDGPVEVLIPPFILHWITVQSEETWFLEQQSRAFTGDAHFGVSEFEALQRELTVSA